MAQECSLTAPLTLKETQAGVVGETGTVWIVAPDCSFTVARQIGPKLLEPHKHGHLTREQGAQLKEMLAQIGDTSVATPSEPASHVNPHRISLSYGDRQAVLTLPPATARAGGSPAAAGSERGEKLLQLAATLKGMLGR